MDRPIIVLGSGGHARVLLDALLSQAANILGIADPDLTKIGTDILGVPILGDDSAVLKYSNKRIYLVNGIGFIGSTNRRKDIVTKFEDQGYSFATVIHRSAVIASDVQLQEGVQIMAGAIIQVGCRILKNTIINTKASVDHDCYIGAHAHIAPGSTLSGGISIGNETHIGTGATVVQGVRIGCKCLVAAGSVVIHDVSDGQVVMGVPARRRLI